MIDRAITELINIHQLIEPMIDKMIRIVSVLPKKYTANITSATVRVQRAHGRPIWFNEESVRDTDPAIKGLKNSLRKSCDIFERLSNQQLSAETNYGMIAEMRAKVNHYAFASYSQDELIYTQCYKAAIYRIAAALLNRGIFVMAGSGPVAISNAVLAARKKVEFIGSDEYGLCLTELEQLCKEKKVGIVYFSSRLYNAFPNVHSFGRMETLLALQRIYKFKIIEDDNFAYSSEHTANQFMDLIFEKKVDVIYIRPYFLISSELSKIVLIAGPAKIIALINRQLQVTCNTMSAASINGLYVMARRKGFIKYENRIKKAMVKSNLLARTIFNESGLWKEQGISYPEGWHFCLEPIEGKLPHNYYELLSKAGVFVINPADYGNNADQVNKVNISIAGYLSSQHLQADLKTLLALLEEMLCNNKPILQ